MKWFASIVLAIVFCGCSATLTRLPRPLKLSDESLEPLETIEVSNANFLLLSCFPIASGDPQSPNGGGCRWFKDTVTVTNQLVMLENEAARIGATRAIGITTLKTHESWCFFLLEREKLRTSAILVRDKKEGLK